MKMKIFIHEEHEEHEEELFISRPEQENSFLFRALSDLRGSPRGF